VGGSRGGSHDRGSWELAEIDPVLQCAVERYSVLQSSALSCSVREIVGNAKGHMRYERITVTCKKRPQGHISRLVV